MSAIAGLLRFDGGAVTRLSLERAANALRQYGPDRADVTVGEGIGLVHVLMRMTPKTSSIASRGKARVGR